MCMHLRHACMLQVSGADALLATRSSEATTPQANVVNCTLRNNSATNGGGVLFSSVCQDGMPQACQALSLSGSRTRMLENVALGGSGADVWVMEVGMPCSCICTAPHRTLHHSNALLDTCGSPVRRAAC
jgi:hypothetical protein